MEQIPVSAFYVDGDVYSIARDENGNYNISKNGESQGLYTGDQTMVYMARIIMEVEHKLEKALRK